MMITSEHFLKNWFLRATKDSEILVAGVEAGQTYYTNGNILLVTSSLRGEPDNPVTAVAHHKDFGRDIPIDALKPENRCFSESTLDASRYSSLKGRHFVPVGDTLVDIKDESYSIKLRAKPKIRKYAAPLVAPDKIPIDCRVQLGVDSKNSLILKLTKNSEILLMPLAVSSFPETISFNYHGCVITPDKWSDADKAYKTLKKEDANMATKLPSLPSIGSVIKAAEKVTPGITEELEKEGAIATDLTSEEEAEKMLEEITAAKEEPKEEVPVEDIPAEPLKEEPAEDPVEEAPKKVIKRVNKPKANLKDLSSVIEQISATVPDDISVEDVLKEVRQLRDLIKVASCRMSNLSTAALEKTAKAASILEALKKSLK